MSYDDMSYDEWNVSKRIVWCLNCRYQNEIPDVTSTKVYRCYNCNCVL